MYAPSQYMCTASFATTTPPLKRSAPDLPHVDHVLPPSDDRQRNSACFCVSAGRKWEPIESRPSGSSMIRSGSIPSTPVFSRLDHVFPWSDDHQIQMPGPWYSCECS